MKNPSFELRTAIFTRLTTGNNKINWDVFDDVPENQTPPYVQMGECRETDSSSKSEPEFELVFTFHIWSIQNSWKEVNNIVQDITESLTLTNSQTVNFLTLTNFTHTYSAIDGYNELIDLDNRTRHGILDIKYLLAEK